MQAGWRRQENGGQCWLYDKVENCPQGPKPLSTQVGFMSELKLRPPKNLRITVMQLRALWSGAAEYVECVARLAVRCVKIGGLI